jgi:hypothetical protein
MRGQPSRIEIRILEPGLGGRLVVRRGFTISPEAGMGLLSPWIIVISSPNEVFGEAVKG